MIKFRKTIWAASHVSEWSQAQVSLVLRMNNYGYEVKDFVDEGDVSGDWGVGVNPNSVGSIFS